MKLYESEVSAEARGSRTYPELGTAQSDMAHPCISYMDEDIGMSTLCTSVSMHTYMCAHMCVYIREDRECVHITEPESQFHCQLGKARTELVGGPDMKHQGERGCAHPNQKSHRCWLNTACRHMPRAPMTSNPSEESENWDFSETS
jgi:hypothetical protein